MSVGYRGPSFLEPVARHWRCEFFGRATYLYLSGPEYNDEVVPHICRLRHLQEVVLNRTRITDEGIASIRQALPDCKVGRIGEKDNDSRR